MLNALEKLSEASQRRVLELAELLAATEAPGVPGTELVKFAGSIDPAELDLMEQAIEAGCERVDNEW